MKIVQGLPPNYEVISKTFHFSSLPATFNPVFSYGDTLYNPTGLPISQDLMVHEETHERQQKIGVEQWWAMYLENKAFRLTQEVEAYGEQYKFLKTVLNRKGRFAELERLSDDLSSKLYGSIINKRDAKELIENYG